MKLLFVVVASLLAQSDNEGKSKFSSEFNYGLVCMQVDHGISTYVSHRDSMASEN